MEKTTDSKICRIAIVGSESTGKSTLAEILAIHYRTVFVPEYARGYIENLNRPYTLDDIINISKEQMKLEDLLAPLANKLLFCDTNLVVTKIWAEYKYGQCPQWIADEVKKRYYDLYLLCNIDHPWEEDPQREHQHKREELFAIYKNELDKMQVPYSIISGVNNLRAKNAIEVIDKYLRNL